MAITRSTSDGALDVGTRFVVCPFFRLGTTPVAPRIEEKFSIRAMDCFCLCTFIAKHCGLVVLISLLYI